jgi:hypothetical protein
MWRSLNTIHQTCGDQTENQFMHKLMDMRAGKGDNIIQHFANIKQLWDCITLICQDKLPFTPEQFKKHLSYSLPPLWDEFSCQFFHDPIKKNMNVPQFIGECHEEYHCHMKCGNEQAEAAYAASSKPLAKCIGDAATSTSLTAKKKTWYTHCGCNNHKVEDCYHATKPKCKACNL